MAEAGKTALIVGISGQDGAYLARLLLGQGYAVHGTSRDATANRFANLERLGLRQRVSLCTVAPVDYASVLAAVERIAPQEIYNLSGLSSVGQSFAEPTVALQSITLATHNLLEALRSSGLPARLFNAGSGECFGDTGGAAADEATPYRPRSPYAVAKAAAQWQVAVYRETYGLFAGSGILFNHESPLRPPRFVTRKVVQAAARIAAGDAVPLALGDLSIQRDWGWAPDYVEAMWRMLQQDNAEDFVLATGQAHALEHFVAAAFAAFGLDWRDHVRVDPALFRPAEVRCCRGNPAKAERLLGWTATAGMAEVAARMAAAEREAGAAARGAA